MVTFTAGQQNKPVDIQVCGDDQPEEDETFFVNLTLISGTATIIDPQGQGTIEDND
jgi:hypothetical protein